jgi:hypothetical protein
LTVGVEKKDTQKEGHMQRKSIQAVFSGFLGISAALMGCAPKRSISLSQPSFRLQSLKIGSVLFAPTVPESQATNAAVILTLGSTDRVVSVPSACTTEKGLFRLEHTSGTPTAIQIFLPTPEKWLSHLEGRSKADDGDVVETFYSFLADLDRWEEVGCFASTSFSLRDYTLQSIPMRPSESLFNAYGYGLERSGLDLKRGLRLRIERAYFRPVGSGEEEYSIKNYLGVSTTRFDVELASDGKIRFQQIGAIQYSPESLEKDGEEGHRDLSLQDLQGQAHYRLLFYTYLVPKAHGISAAIIGASNAGQLDELEQKLRAHPEESCRDAAKARGEYCFEFKGFVTVSTQIKVELNGKSQFVDWGTKVKSIVPRKALKSLTMQRQFMGSYYDVCFDPANSNILSLVLVGGDRLTWSKGAANFH